MKYLTIRKEEVLRYLGFKNQTLEKDMNNLIEETIEEMRNLAKVRYVYKPFNIDRGKDEIILLDTKMKLLGRDIYKHLEKSQKCILMAVTLGSEIDMKIRYYEKINMTKALILDACATTAIEEACDEICGTIENGLIEKNKKLTWRFSPGYGDLPIESQKDFISVLEGNKTIGLTVSDHSILLPRKSVTAVVGIIDNTYESKKRNCLNCNKYSTCEFRKDGKGCEA